MPYKVRNCPISRGMDPDKTFLQVQFCRSCRDPNLYRKRTIQFIVLKIRNQAILLPVRAPYTTRPATKNATGCFSTCRTSFPGARLPEWERLFPADPAFNLSRSPIAKIHNYNPATPSAAESDTAGSSCFSASPLRSQRISRQRSNRERNVA